MSIEPARASLNDRIDEVDEDEQVPRFNIPRRKFLQFCAAITASMGLPRSAMGAVEKALTQAPRPSVIWLQFQECTGS